MDFPLPILWIHRRYVTMKTCGQALAETLGKLAVLIEDENGDADRS
jgi:hypothetical protein